MWFIFSALYLVVGGFVCYFIKTNCGDCFVDWTGEDYGTLMSIVTGAFWPIVSPFTVAIIFAKKKGRK